MYQQFSMLRVSASLKARPDVQINARRNEKPRAAIYILEWHPGWPIR